MEFGQYLSRVGKDSASVAFRLCSNNLLQKVLKSNCGNRLGGRLSWTGEVTIVYQCLAGIVNSQSIEVDEILGIAVALFF